MKKQKLDVEVVANEMREVRIVLLFSALTDDS
jgi:hypothetical protein